jgi:hypothetical protein
MLAWLAFSILVALIIQRCPAMANCLLQYLTDGVIEALALRYRQCVRLA